MLHHKIGLFYKNPNTRGWGYTFFTFTIRNSAENKLSPLKILKNCVRSLGNSKTHENSTWVFLEHPYKFHFFFNWPLEIPHALLSIPLEVPCLQPPYLDFFWNSLLEVVFIYIKFQFCDILLSWSYCYTAVPWFGINFLLFILFPQRIYLIYNDSSDVCPCFSHMVPCFLQVSP